jgi:beta-glucosidase
VARPLLELKGFGKIALRPGETGTVELSLPASDLRFSGPDLTPVFEPGDVEILVGPCADRSRLLIGGVRLRASPIARESSEAAAELTLSSSLRAAPP